MATINFFYQQFVTTTMTIDEDTNGLFVNVPSESNGESYEVRCTEHADHVEVESCQCLGFRRWSHCKHASIVQSFWNKIYASNIAKANEKALEQAMLEVELIEEQYEQVEMIEILEPSTKELDGFRVVLTQSSPIAPKLVKRGNKLVKRMDGQSARTLDFFEGLPSRKKPAA